MILIIYTSDIAFILAHPIDLPLCEKFKIYYDDFSSLKPL